MIDTKTLVNPVVGRTWNESISFVDPGTESINYSVDYGDGSPAFSGTTVDRVILLNHVYTATGNRSIVVTVNDGSGPVARTFALAVQSNSAPVVSKPIPSLLVDNNTTDRAFFANLHQVFSDQEDPAGQLTYSFVNTNGSLVTPTIDSMDMLHLDLASSPAGQSLITVRATDTAGAFAESTFTVSAASTSNNRAPIAANDSISGPVLAVYALPLLGNDSDPDGNLISITAVNGNAIVLGSPVTLSLGRLELVSTNGEVNFHFFPNGQVGTQSFTYTISDGELTSEATVTITLAQAKRIARRSQRPIRLETAFRWSWRI